MQLSVYVGVCENECACPQRPKILDPWNLELQLEVSYPMWVLRIELGSSGRLVCALNCEPYIQTPFLYFLIKECAV